MKYSFPIIALLIFHNISTSQTTPFPYTENFDTVAVPLIPAGWTTSFNKHPDGDFKTSGSSPRSGSLPNCISASDARLDQYLISPPLNFSEKLVDSLEFYERRTSTFQAGLLIDASIDDDTLFSVTVSDTLRLTSSNNGAYQRRSVSLPEILNGRPNVRLRWRIVGSPMGGATAVLRFDDISVTTKKRLDLAVQSLATAPSSPRKGDTIFLKMVITNRALSGMQSGTVQLFDSLTLIATRQFSSVLNGNESLTVFLNYPHITAGRHPMIVNLNVEGDEDTTNNSISKIVTAGYRERTILINEIMYAPSGGMPEWIEFINNSADTIPVYGLKVSDAGTTKAVFSPSNRRILPYNYFLAATDTNSFRSIYTTSSQVFQSGFSALNNSGDAVIVFDQNNNTIDSLFYNSSWGGESGFSLERIDTSIGSVLQSNWKTSMHRDGATPGTINSVTQKPYDIAIHKITTSPELPIAGNTCTILSSICNIGKENISSVHMKIFLDANNDSTFTENELLEEQTLPFIASKDSSMFHTIVPVLQQGKYWLSIKFFAARDDDTTNNFMVFPLVIGSAPRSIVINEIMYAPTGDMPEWIEGFNTTLSPLSIAGWSISDNGTTRAKTSNSKIVIPAQTFFVITADTVQFRNTFPSVSLLIYAPLPALNNTTPDAVVVRDERGVTIDSVMYTPQWGGTNGNSIQRYDLFASSLDSTNWRSAFPTAGGENEISRKDFDVMIRRVTATRYSQGAHISAVIVNEGRNTGQSITLNFYHDKNKNGMIESDEFLSQSSLSMISPLDSGTIEFYWNVSLHGKQRIFAAAEYDQDQRIQNNTAFTTVTNNFPPHTIVFNEIMYEPESGNAEFVELLNNSSDSIDIAEWKLMDQPGTSGSRTIIPLSLLTTVIPPGGFILVASDSSIFHQRPFLVGRPVIINSSLSLNNGGEDIVLSDLTNTVIDSVHYFPAWHLDNVRTPGRSLERIDPAGASTDNRNWSSSVAQTGSSPMQINSIFTKRTAPAKTLSLSPNPFSPDRDGFEDFLSINYALPTNSSIIRIKIFDVTGRLIRHLVLGEPSPATGSILWNGNDDDGNSVRIGMYIILFEALDNFGGTAMVMKDVAVVARKL